MSEGETGQSFDPNNQKDVLARIDAMQAEITRLKTNPRDLPTRQHCNVCGDEVKPGERCARHPFDKVNHVRDGLASEPASVLVKQV